MSILSRFSRAPEKVEVKELPHECSHWELAPRWDSAADMGNNDRVSYYTCTSCKQNFTPEEAKSFAAQ